MSNHQLAYRYSKSLYELATENNHLDAVRQDMRHFHSLINENKDLAGVLNSPVMKASDKQAILEKIAADMQPEVLRFIGVLVNKNRESALKDIAVKFEEIYNKNHGIANATVMSAIPLTDASLEKVRELLAKQIEAKKIVLINKVDPSIIGGVVVQYEDQLLDMSVASELRKIRKELIFN